MRWLGSILACVLVAVAQARVNIKNNWGSGFEGETNVPVERAINGGWTLIMQFNKPCTNMQIWDAIVADDGGGWEIKLRNMGHNGDLGAGSTLTMTFICETPQGTPDSMWAFFEGQGPSPTGGPDPTGGPNPTNNPNPGKYDYGDVLGKSMLFLEANRAGWMPENKRIDWRGNAATDDKGLNGEDLTGGWFDAGDHVKFGFPMSATTTVVAWGIAWFRDGYKAAGQYQWALECVKWPLDYFIKAHVSDNELYGQVGDGYDDHAWWGRPEEMPGNRPSWKITAQKPGSELAGEHAAAMAAGAVVFKDEDPAYAAKLIDHAKRLYNFAESYRGKYTDHIPANDFYGSWGDTDELCWAAMWLYEATGEQQYISKAEQHMTTTAPDTFSWDDKAIGCSVLHYKHTKSESSKRVVEDFIRKWRRGGSIKYTPKGLAWVMKWGANRYASNSALVAMAAAEVGIMPNEAREFSFSQLDYILGDGGRSFVCGWGNNPPTQPHHKGSSCPWPPAACGWNEYNAWGPNPHILYGALVGGPDENDGYEDKRSDYIKNEVATDYNAGFQGALAAAVQHNAK